MRAEQALEARRVPSNRSIRGQPTVIGVIGVTEAAVPLLMSGEGPERSMAYQSPGHIDGPELPARRVIRSVDVVCERDIAWPPDDARTLLLQPGVGPALLNQLRAAGILSLADLRAVGVEAAIERICMQTGTRVWRNKLRALRSVGAA